MNNFSQWCLGKKKNATRKLEIFQLGTINSNRLICEYQIPSRLVLYPPLFCSRVDRTNSVIAARSSITLSGHKVIIS